MKNDSGFVILDCSYGEYISKLDKDNFQYVDYHTSTDSSSDNSSDGYEENYFIENAEIFPTQKKAEKAVKKIVGILEKEDVTVDVSDFMIKKCRLAKNMVVVRKD